MCCFVQSCAQLKHTLRFDDVVSASGRYPELRIRPAIALLYRGSRMMLDYFLAANRDEIIARCRANVATRSFPVAVAPESDHGIPLFLDQLMDALRMGSSSHGEIGRSALRHGHDLLLRGFSVSQVVHTYGDVCQATTQLAMEMNAPISAADFRTLNQCLDDAIAGAVTEYGRERDESTRDVAAAHGSARVGFLAHELRNLVNTALVAFEVLKTGNVGVSGSTGSVLHRSLLGLRSLVGQSLAEVRLTQGVQRQEPILVSGFIEEIGAAATLEALAKGLRLTVLPVEDGVAIEGDRQVLAAVVGNLLQNAFKFTRPHTRVTLSVNATAERVLLEVEDECGGLPGGNAEHLFRPFEQRGADRTGLGLGLAFSRLGVEANKGRIYARNLPDRGCVFTVDLPRLPAPAVAMV
jgi:signal transduction histidine kinase